MTQRAGIPDLGEQAYFGCMIDEDAIRYRWDTVGSKLDERGRRLFAAAEVRTAGWGGLAIVARITGLARSTLNRGEDDLDAEPLAKGKIRRSGGGRRAVAEMDLELVPELKRLVEPVTLGDPMRPLIWVSKSMDKLAETLTEMGHPISADTVRKELVKLGFSRQHNRKADEGAKHPDRNAQFEHINTKVVAAQAAGQPVISVDTKKKELVGNDRNGGSDYRPKGTPQRVRVHDFVDKELGKAVPYGVYDVAANAGFVSVGITSDTAEFAVEAIRSWLGRMGWQRYPKAQELTITADCGGSNGARVRLWKTQLQKLADETGLVLHVHHYPPGTSKWNKACPREGGDRAPPVLSYHAELAWPTADGSSRHRRVDRCHDDKDRVEGRVRARHANLREGHQGKRRRDGDTQHHRRALPSRMELHR